MAQESPESQFETLKKRLQDSILRDYPNPKRIGCPGRAVVRQLAGRPLDERIESDANWHHVTHCSECYRDFLGFQPQLRRQVQRQKLRLVLGLSAAAAMIALGMFLVKQNGNPVRRQNAELAYVKKTVDIESMERSANPSRPTEPIYLERNPLELTVQLPAGSKAGMYEFQLQKSGQPVVATSGAASIREGTTAFAVRIDLTRVEAGEYSMSVRQVPWDWSYYPVVVR
jgi:hypothetical protein